MKKFLMSVITLCLLLCSCNSASQTENVTSELESIQPSQSTEALLEVSIAADIPGTLTDTSSKPVSPPATVSIEIAVEEIDEDVEATTSTPDVSTPAATSEPQTTSVTTSEEVEAPISEITQKDGPTVIPTLCEILGKTTGKVNFRSSPDYGDNIITTVDPNTEVTVLNYTDNTEFAKVRVSGVDGFIHQSYLKMETSKLIAIKDTTVEVGGKESKVKSKDRLTIVNTPEGYALHSNLKPIKFNSEDFVDEAEYKDYLFNNAERELLTSFSTLYSLEDEYAGKAYNIELCCTEVTTVILDGEDFNWHVVVGDTGKNEGYALANIFSGGKTVKGYGGGVCQVTTTIYNCVLNLDMKVKELHHHGLRVEYVDWDNKKDAAVGDIGQQNFIFENDLGCDLIIVAYTSTVEENPLDQRGKLTVEFYKAK